MQYNETAIFSDLDGTLFDSSGKVNERNKSAIRRYIAEGGLFAIATGRCPANMQPYLVGVPYNAPSIVLNGGGIYDPATDSFLYTVFADRDALAAVLRFARANLPLVNLQVYTEQDILYVSPRETLNIPFWELHQTSCFVSIEEAERDDWFKALLFGTPEELAVVQRFLDESGLPERFDYVYATTDIVPNSRYIELLPKGSNKGTALNACRSLPEYAGRTLFGVGDYNNDRELLTEADIAAAPCNGHPDILRMSDLILCTNNEGAIGDLIDRIPSL
ncbi:MAG: HAD hydrolase family protein [Clostridia bacterium]|nr:HAD hydrolase family protein [Clostridia bacterium]